MSIRFKLVLAFFLSNALLASLMFFISSWRFDEGFLAYITRVEAQRLQPLLGELAEIYALEQSWQPLLENKRQWHDLMDQYVMSNNGPAPLRHLQRFGPTDEHRPPGGPKAERAPPRPPGQQHPGREPLSFDPRVLLSDKDKTLLIGPKGRKLKAEWTPIESSGHVIGYLGLIRRDQLQGSLDKVFVQEQKKAFGLIALGSLIIALVIGLISALMWLRPIHKLQQGMLKLSAGDYSQRLDTSSTDEMGELARRFNLLARTLEENKADRDQWIGDIAHELRTPIAVLRGEVEAMLEGVRPLNRQNLTSLHEEIQQLEALVKDLHELSMSDLGALNYQKSKVDFTALLHKLIQQFSQVCAAQGLTLQYDGMKEAVFLTIDERRFRQMLANLLQNTLRYTDTPGTLSIRCWTKNSELLLQWSDSSPGVDIEEQKRLFERLYRAENSRNRRTGGSGLGLAIVKNIAEAHEGTITVASSPLGGLQFDLRLPLQ